MISLRVSDMIFETWHGQRLCLCLCLYPDEVIATTADFPLSSIYLTIFRSSEVKFSCPGFSVHCTNPAEVDWFKRRHRSRVKNTCDSSRDFRTFLSPPWVLVFFSKKWAEVEAAFPLNAIHSYACADRKQSAVQVRLHSEKMTVNSKTRILN